MNVTNSLVNSQLPSCVHALRDGWFAGAIEYLRSYSLFDPLIFVSISWSNCMPNQRVCLVNVIMYLYSALIKL